MFDPNLIKKNNELDLLLNSSKAKGATKEELIALTKEYYSKNPDLKSAISNSATLKSQKNQTEQSKVQQSEIPKEKEYNFFKSLDSYSLGAGVIKYIADAYKKPQQEKVFSDYSKAIAERQNDIKTDDKSAVSSLVNFLKPSFSETTEDDIKKANSFSSSIGSSFTLGDNKEYKINFGEDVDDDKLKIASLELQKIKKEKEKQIEDYINEQKNNELKKINYNKVSTTDFGTEGAEALKAFDIEKKYKKKKDELISDLEKEYNTIIGNFITPQVRKNNNLLPLEKAVVLPTNDNLEETLKNSSEIFNNLSKINDFISDTNNSQDLYNTLGTFNINVNYANNLEQADLKKKAFYLKDDNKDEGIYLKNPFSSYSLGNPLVGNLPFEFYTPSGISKSEKDKYVFGGLKDQVDLLNNYESIINDEKIGLLPSINKNLKETEEFLKEKNITFDQLDEKTKKQISELTAYRNTLEKNAQDIKAVKNKLIDWGKKNVYSYFEKEAQQEIINKEADLSPIASTIFQIGKDSKDIPKKAISFLLKKEIKDPLVEEFIKSSRTTDLKPQIIQGEQLVNLDEAEAIKLFKDGKFVGFKNMVSPRPLLYQTLETSIHSYILGGVGGITESTAARLATGASKSLLKTSSIAGALAESELYKNTAKGVFYKALDGSVVLSSDILKIGNRLGSMVIPTSLIFSNEIYDNFREQGFTPSEAETLTNLSAFIEGGTESIFGNEVKFFNAFLGKTENEILKKTSEEIFEKVFSDRFFDITKRQIKKSELNFVKNLYKSIKNSDFINNVKLFSKEFLSTGLEESSEEVIGNLATALLVDPLAKSYNKLYKEQGFDLTEQLNTVVATMATMLPMSTVAGVNNISKNKIEALSAKYEVGAAPSIYLQTLSDLLKDYKIEANQYEKSVTLVNFYSDLYKSAEKQIEANPSFGKYTDKEKTILKQKIFGELLKKSKLAEYSNFAISDKQKEELLEELNKVENNLYIYLTKGLYDTEKERLEVNSSQLSYLFNQPVVEKINDEKKLVNIINSLTEYMNNEDNAQMKLLYSEKINLLTNKLNSLQNKQEESSTDVEQVDTKTNEEDEQKKPNEEEEIDLNKNFNTDKVYEIINSKEDYTEEELMGLKEELLSNEIKDEKEITKLVDLVNEKLQNLKENIKSEKFGTLKKGDGVVLFEDPQNYYQIKEIDEQGNLIVSFVNGENRKVLNSKEEIAEIFPKAELIDKLNKIKSQKEEIVKSFSENEEDVEEQEDGKDEESQKTSTEDKSESEEDKQESDKSDKEQKVKKEEDDFTRVKNKIKKLISSFNIGSFNNLEKAKEAVDSFKKEIGKLILKESNIINAYESLKNELLSFQKKLESNLNVYLEIEKKEKEQSEDKTTYSVFYPLSTVSNRFSKEQILQDPIASTQVVVWEMLSKPIVNNLFYASVKKNDLPLEYQYSDTKNEYNRIKEEKGEEEANKFLTNGRIVIITNDLGDILYFNNNGEIVSKEEGGFPAYQYLRNPDSKTFVKASEKDLEKLNITKEEYDSDLEKLRNIRQEAEEKTIVFNIKKINFVSDGQTKTNISELDSEVSPNNYIIGEKIYVITNDNNKYAAERPVLSNTSFWEGIVAVLSGEKIEGLTNNSQKTDFLEQFINTTRAPKVLGDPDGFQIRKIKGSDKFGILIKRIGQEDEFLSYEETIEKLKNRFLYIESRLLKGNNIISVIEKTDDGKYIKVEKSYSKELANNIKVYVPKKDMSKSTLLLGEKINEEVVIVSSNFEISEDILANSQEQAENSVSDITEKEIVGKESSLNRKNFQTKNKSFNRSRLLFPKKRITESQLEKAKSFFEKYLKESGVSFNDYRNLFNPEAFANWYNGAITLFEGSDFTDFYHEAFHDFTQYFLTPSQKIALYKEAESSKVGKEAIDKFVKKELEKNPNYKLTEIDKFFVLEELLAEDFREYLLSNQKLILNNRVKRNSIFRKIYNFLKFIFTGKQDIQTIYENLANVNLKSYKRDPLNAFFGKLNKDIPGFDLTESESIYSGIDFVLSSELKQKGVFVPSLFKIKNGLNIGYSIVYDYFVNTYNSFFDEYEKSNKTEEEKEYIKSNIEKLEKIIENWDLIISKHYENSKYLDVSKHISSFDLEESDENSEEEYTKESLYEEKEKVSMASRASSQLMFLIASIPKYEWVDGKQVEKSNKFLPFLQTNVDFSTMWEKVSSIAKDTYTYEEIYEKLKNESEKDKEVKELLERLPNPNNNNLTLLSMQLRNQFVNIFGSPVVDYFITKVVKKEDKINVYESKSSTKNTNKLISDWNLNIQKARNSEFVILPESKNGLVQLNLPKILDSFKELGYIVKKSDEKNQEFQARKKELFLNFLKAIGFELSPMSINSFEFNEFVKSNNPRVLYLTIKQLNQLTQKNEKGFVYEKTLADIPFSSLVIDRDKFVKPVTSIINSISKSIWVSNNTGEKIQLLNGLGDTILNELFNIEISNSGVYNSDVVMNPNKDLVYTKRPWSLLSIMYNFLNNEKKYPNYQSLISSHLGYVFDIQKNPDMDNVYMRNIFNLSNVGNYGERIVGSDNKIQKLKLITKGGLEIFVDSFTKKKSKTIDLTKFDRMIHSIMSFYSGVLEHVRYGDKSSTNGTLMSFKKSSNDKISNYLPINITDFTKDVFVPNEALIIFKKALVSAIKRTNDQLVYKKYANIQNFEENVNKKEYYGFFDYIISLDLELLKNFDSVIDKPDLDVEKLVNDNEQKFKDVLTEFFKENLKELNNRISSNPYFDKSILLNDSIINKLLVLENTKISDSKSENLNTLLKAYMVNSYILNMEHIRLIFGDIRFYKNKNDSFEEAFKRFSKASSTGTIATNDTQVNKFLENSNVELKVLQEEQPDLNYILKSDNSVERIAIMNDVKMTADDFIKDAINIFDNLSAEELLQISKSFTNVETTDAASICTLDFYRNWEIKSGNDNWNNEKEQLYLKIAKGEPLSRKEIVSYYNFFPPKKLRIVGFIKKQSYIKEKNIIEEVTIPFDIKTAVMSLIPNMLGYKANDEIRKNMLRQGVSIMSFASSSKHSAIMNDENSFNKFYIDGKVNTGDYVINEVPLEFVLEVVASPNSLKNKITEPTQKRTIMFSNLFDRGFPINKKVEDLFNKILSLRQRRFNLEKEKFYKSIGAIFKNGELIELDEEKLSNILQKDLLKRNLPNNVINSLSVKNGKFVFSLDSSVARKSLESILLSVIDNKLRKTKVYGESLVQVSSIGFESNTLNRVKTWNSINGNDLPFYINKGRKNKKGEDVTTASKVKIAINKNFKKLYDLEDVKKLSKEKRIINGAKERNYSPELVALNELIKDKNWLDKSGVREMITLVGERIPIQAPNSMEFAEVYEFLPESAGSIVIVSPFIVGKTGSDMDWDKISFQFPELYYDKINKKVLLYTLDNIKLNDKNLSSLIKESKSVYTEYKSIKKEKQELIKEIKEKVEKNKFTKEELKSSIELIESEIDNLSNDYDILLEISSFSNLYYDNIGELNEAQLLFFENLFDKNISLEKTEGLINTFVDSLLKQKEDKLNELKAIKENISKIKSERKDLIKDEKSKLDELNKKITTVLRSYSKIQNEIFNISEEKAINNDLIKYNRELLEMPEMYEELMFPNGTFLFEPISDKIKDYKSKNKGYSFIPLSTKSDDQFESNKSGKDSLGILAVFNKLFAAFQKAGLEINPLYYKKGLNSNYRKEYYHILPHNKNGENTSVSNIYSQPYKGNIYKISHSFQQLMNGFVDVAKKDWVYFINAVKQLSPVMQYLLVTGVNKDVVLAYMNQPFVEDFLKELKNSKTFFSILKDNSSSSNKQVVIFYNILKKYIPEDYTVFLKKREVNVIDLLDFYYEKELFRELRTFITFTLTPQLFDDFVENKKELYNPEYFEKFAIPFEENNVQKLLIPETRDEKLLQAFLFLQFLEYLDHARFFNVLSSNANQDTKKAKSPQLANKRIKEIETLKSLRFFELNSLNKFLNESMISPYINPESGIDKIVTQIFNKTFTLTNNSLFINKLNNYFFDLPETYYNSNTGEEEVNEGNNIPYETRFEVYDDWIDSVKNQFFTFMYSNYVFYENEKVSSLYFKKWILPRTALANELDAIKKDYPDLVKNYPILDFLYSDNFYTKDSILPEKVYISPRSLDIDNDTIDTFEKNFKDLYYFSDENYKPEDHIRIQSFMEKLSHYAVIQSNTAFSFINILPNDIYAKNMNNIILEFEKFINESKNEEKVYDFLNRFLESFKENNPNFYRNLTYITEFYYRVKNYDVYLPVDLGGIVQYNLKQKRIKRSQENSEISNIDISKGIEKTAKENPRNIYIVFSESSKQRSYEKDNLDNIIVFPLSDSYPSNRSSSYFNSSEKSVNEAKKLLDVSYKKVISLMNSKNQENGNFNYDKIIFPNSIPLDLYKTDEKSPEYFNYLLEKMMDDFNIVYPTYEYLIKNVNDNFVVNPTVFDEIDIDGENEVYIDDNKNIEELRGEKEVEQPTFNIIPIYSNFTRTSVEKDKDYIYLFTDNAKRTSGKNSIDAGSWYRQKYTGTYPLSFPSMTQAVIRGLNNAFPITTMVDDNRTQWKDSQFEEYKKIIDDEIETIKKALINYKGIKFAAQMPFGKGQISNMKQSAPKIWEYMNQKLKEIGIDNTGEKPIVFQLNNTETNNQFIIEDIDILNSSKLKDVVTKNDEYKWSRYSDNSYEVSSQGDKRFSALFAKLKDGRTIEEAYQLDIKGYRSKGNDWKLGKGKAPIRNITKEQSWQEYKGLWKQYLEENPDLRKDLEEKAKGRVLTDKFASTDISQARALAEILNELKNAQENNFALEDIGLLNSPEFREYFETLPEDMQNMLETNPKALIKHFKENKC